jgi:hypothetical protein
MFHILSEESASNGEWGNSSPRQKCMLTSPTHFLHSKPAFWREKLIHIGTATASVQDQNMINYKPNVVLKDDTKFILWHPWMNTIDVSKMNNK